MNSLPVRVLASEQGFKPVQIGKVEWVRPPVQAVMRPSGPGEPPRFTFLFNAETVRALLWNIGDGIQPFLDADAGRLLLSLADEAHTSVRKLRRYGAGALVQFQRCGPLKAALPDLKRRCEVPVLEIRPGAVVLDLKSLPR